MDLLLLGLNIALFFGAIAGFLSIFTLPFLAYRLNKHIEGLEKEQKAIRGLIAITEKDLRYEIDALHNQLDEIESDLERANLSSLPKGPTSAIINQPKKSILDKIIKTNVKSVGKKSIHPANKKQGGKRENKSRNR